MVNAMKRNWMTRVCALLLLLSLTVLPAGAQAATHQGLDVSVWQGEIDFAGLQAAVEALAASEFTEEAPAEQLEISFTAHLDSETFPQVEAALYRWDGESCLAVVDGEPVCLVDRSAVVDLMEAVRTIVLGGGEET